MATSSHSRLDPLDGQRFRLLGGAHWRHLLRAGLGGGELAWTLRRLGSGELFLAATRDGLCRVHLAEVANVEALIAESLGGELEAEAVRHADGLLAPFARRLEAWLEAPAEVELDLPVDAAGTDFQREVWKALTLIPLGEVRSYKDVAVALGRAAASRAVGGACGANPVPFVVPCHRVVGSDGRMTGFGLGVEMKERLLGAEAGIRTLPL